MIKKAKWHSSIVQDRHGFYIRIHPDFVKELELKHGDQVVITIIKQNMEGSQ